MYSPYLLIYDFAYNLGLHKNSYLQAIGEDES